MQKILIGVLLLFVAVGSAFSAPSFFSTTGNILTPDDTLLTPGGFSINYHAIDYEDTDATPTIIGANVGVTPFLELGIARYDPDVAHADEETIINGKYLIAPETATRPSILAGVVDFTGELDEDNDPGLYLLVSKNLTRLASEMSGAPSRPLRGHLGFGTGIFDGLFASLDWTLNDRFSLMVEYLSGHEMCDGSAFNVGVRFALSNELRGDLALIDGDNLGFGISFTRIGL